MTEIVPIERIANKRFPGGFMFELTKEELENWRSQFVTSNRDKMGLIGFLRESQHAEE